MEVRALLQAILSKIEGNEEPMQIWEKALVTYGMTTLDPNVPLVARILQAVEKLETIKQDDPRASTKLGFSATDPVRDLLNDSYFYECDSEVDYDSKLTAMNPLPPAPINESMRYEGYLN
jgi:hypothetical protein